MAIKDIKMWNIYNQLIEYSASLESNKNDLPEFIPVHFLGLRNDEISIVKESRKIRHMHNPEIALI